jgi:S1-C subfamily serine protease
MMKSILVALACFFASGSVSALEKQVPQSRHQVQLSFAPLVKQVSPAVVNIYTTKITSARRGLSLFNDHSSSAFLGKVKTLVTRSQQDVGSKIPWGQES